MCYKCGKIGYSFECPNHPNRAKVFALGIEEEPADADPEFVDTDANDEAQPENDDPQVVNEEEAEDRFVEDPYEPDQPAELESEPEDEVAFGCVGL